MKQSSRVIYRIFWGAPGISRLKCSPPSSTSLFSATRHTYGAGGVSSHLAHRLPPTNRSKQRRPSHLKCVPRHAGDEANLGIPTWHRSLPRGTKIAAYLALHDLLLLIAAASMYSFGVERAIIKTLQPTVHQSLNSARPVLS